MRTEIEIKTAIKNTIHRYAEEHLLDWIMADMLQKDILMAFDEVAS